MKKDTKLYNVIFPTFMLLVIHPLMWILSLVGNFIIDSLVLLSIILIVCKKLDFKIYIKNIFPIWIFGFIADFIGAIYLMTVYGLISDYHEQADGIWQHIQNGVHFAADLQHYNFWGIIYVLSGIVLAGILIYFCDYFMFKLLSGFSKKQCRYSALAFAIITAPYTYLLPSTSFDWWFDLVLSLLN